MLLLNLARFVKTFPCVAVYMSSLTNMAIAVDRYRFIVRSQSPQVVTLVTLSVYTPVCFRSPTLGP